MVDGVGTFLLLVATGMVLFRPRDVPFLARSAGRAVGLSVRGMRRARDYGDEFIAHTTAATSSSSSSSVPSAAVTGVHQLKAVQSRLSSLATAVRRDMEDVPASPASFLRSRLRSAMNDSPPLHNRPQQPPQQQWPVNSNSNSNISTHYDHGRLPSPSPSASFAANPAATPARVPGDASPDATAVSSTPPPRASLSPAARSSAGADFISRSIQESALADQQNKFMQGDRGPQSQGSTT